MPINKDIVKKVAGGLVATALFIAGWEGSSNKVYVDPVGIKTVCEGHARTGLNGKPLRAGEVYSDDVCSYLLGQDTLDANKAMLSAVKVPLSPGENLAYTDFVFNVGIGAFRSSSLLAKLNKGDRKGACNGLLAWDKGTVKGKLVTLPGLTKRRAAEAQACLS